MLKSKKYQGYPYSLSRKTLTMDLISSGVKPLNGYYKLMSKKEKILHASEKEEYY